MTCSSAVPDCATTVTGTKGVACSACTAGWLALDKRSCQTAVTNCVAENLVKNEAGVGCTACMAGYFLANSVTCTLCASDCAPDMCVGNVLG